jgi:translation initiation factor 1 (eIF-1/SUI1)
MKKKLKQKLAVGGTIDNNEIILQGDQVDKVIEFLTSLKFNDVKKG